MRQNENVECFFIITTCCRRNYHVIVDCRVVVFLCCCNSQVITDAKSVLGRERKGIILLEGRRLVAEALRTSQSIKSIFFTDAEVLQEFPVTSLAESGVKFYRVKKDHMNLWSDTVAPQGIMGN